MILCMIAVLSFVPTVAVAWTPTSPQVSVAVFGGTGGDYPQSVAVDGSGNIYTVGYFEGTVDFDPGAGTVNLTSAAGNDAFVSKLNSSGDLVWARTFGSTGLDTVKSVAVDGAGNIHIAGSFNGTVDFDPGAGTVNLVSVGYNDAFVSKLNSSGNLVWARSFGGPTSDSTNSVAVDGAGNIYAAGHFQDTADFDPGTGTTNLTSAGGIDAFVSKLNSSGDLIWARGFGGTSSDSANSVAVDGSGNVHTVGHFWGTVDFDPGAGTTNLTSAGEWDVFVSKLNSSGDLVWARTFGGIFTDIAYSLAVDGAGNVHTVGRFQDTVDFDPGAGTTNLASAGSHEAFVSKL